MLRNQQIQLSKAEDRFLKMGFTIVTHDIKLSFMPYPKSPFYGGTFVVMPIMKDDGKE